MIIRQIAEAGHFAYRIETPTGDRTGTGLFASRDGAVGYADDRGWRVIGDRR